MSELEKLNKSIERYNRANKWLTVGILVLVLAVCVTCLILVNKI